jgi:hypothetical protein
MPRKLSVSLSRRHCSSVPTGRSNNAAIVAAAYDRLWHECDLRAAATNVRSWESNGLNAEVAFGPFMTLAV